MTDRKAGRPDLTSGLPVGVLSETSSGFRTSSLAQLSHFPDPLFREARAGGSKT